MNEPLYKQLETIEKSVRPLCLDAMFVGCCIVQQSNQIAGEKLIRTALITAKFDPDLASSILEDIDGALDAICAHTELKSLRKSES